MYRTGFLVGAEPYIELEPPGAYPWEEDPSYYCPFECGPEGTNGWHITNNCPNLADEPLTTEDDWWVTDSNPVIRYNCVAYAVGAREGLLEEGDLWLDGNCDDETLTNTFDLAWLTAMAEGYGWRPSTHCFSECDKRKIVAFGYLDTLRSAWRKRCGSSSTSSTSPLR